MLNRFKRVAGPTPETISNWGEQNYAGSIPTRRDCDDVEPTAPAERITSLVAEKAYSTPALLIVTPLARFSESKRIFFANVDLCIMRFAADFRAVFKKDVSEELRDWLSRSRDWAVYW